MSGKDLIKADDIQSRIYKFRGVQVIIDSDLSAHYNVEIRVLNQAVKRNRERFPDEFSFWFTEEEFVYWKSQIVMSNEDRNLKSQFATLNLGGRRTKLYVFTEQGIDMLSRLEGVKG
jgi:hypothetical protein